MMSKIINLTDFMQNCRRENGNKKLADWLRDLADYIDDDQIACNPKSIIIQLIGDDFDELIYNGRKNVSNDDIIRARTAITKYLDTGKRDNRINNEN